MVKTGGVHVFCEIYLLIKFIFLIVYLFVNDLNMTKVFIILLKNRFLLTCPFFLLEALKGFKLACKWTFTVKSLPLAVSIDGLAGNVQELSDPSSHPLIFFFGWRLYQSLEGQTHKEQGLGTAYCLRQRLQIWGSASNCPNNSCSYRQKLIWDDRNISL